MSYFVDMRDAERQYNRVKTQRDTAWEEVSRANRLLGIYGGALDEIAQETGTPYGTTAQKALDKAAALSPDGPSDDPDHRTAPLHGSQRDSGDSGA